MISFDQGYYQKLFRGEGGVVPSILSLSFFSFSLFSFSFFLPLNCPHPAKGFEGVLLALPGGVNGICSYQTRFMGSKYAKNAAYLEPKTCVVAANDDLFLLNEM